MLDSAPTAFVGELAKRVVAIADAGARAELVLQLARETRSTEQIAVAGGCFLAAGAPGRRIYLEWIARVRSPLPDAILAQIKTLLADRAIPTSVRVLAAARVLRSLPDKLEAVKGIARALTAGLSPLRRLERLRQLQHQMERSHGLDVLIERREQRVKIDCPRCGLRLPREAMVRHLWHEHGLLMDHGKVRSPERTVEELKHQHAATRDTTVLDRTSLLASPAALRAWVAASEPPADDLAPLREAAEEHGAGLCPGCLAEVPAPLQPMPPPLSLAGGRLAGNGYVVEVGGEEWFRTLAIHTPNHTMQSAPDGWRAFGTRGVATTVAALFLLLALSMALFLPQVWASPIMIARLVLVAALGYGLVWFIHKPPMKPSERAVDAAWTILARKMLKGNHTEAWLARLCRASVGHGDPIARVGVLIQVVERATAGGTQRDLQLLAAAHYLQVEDGARHGRDRIAGFASVAAAGFRGEQPIAYAEFVAECVLQANPAPEAGELARFRVLLLAAAFDAGLKPRDLIDLWAVAPNLRRAMAVEPLHRLGLLHGVWTMRPARRWERVAPADSVFDLCRLAPNISGRLLRDFPDLLLHYQPDPDTADQLGPVLVCARGVVVGGQMIANPDAEVRIVKGGRFGGGFELIFGSVRLPLVRKPAGDFADVVREWLRFRAWALLPLLDNYLAPGSPAVAERILTPFERRCDRCGTVAATAVGKVGNKSDE